MTDALASPATSSSTAAIAPSALSRLRIPDCAIVTLWALPLRLPVQASSIPVPTEDFSCDITAMSLVATKILSMPGHHERTSSTSCIAGMPSLPDTCMAAYRPLYGVRYCSSRGPNVCRNRS